MLNHSTRPGNVNTTLQRRTEKVSKHTSSNAGIMEISGFFAIEAGDSLTPLVLLLKTPRSGTIAKLREHHRPVSRAARGHI